MGAWLKEGAVAMAFQLKSFTPARKEYYLKTTAMLEHWRKWSTPCAIRVNGNTLFDGNLFLENVCRGWPSFYLRIPGGFLKKGRNELVFDKGHTEPDQSVIFNNVDVLAYDTGAAFSVAAVPALAQVGQPFAALVKAPAAEPPVAELPQGWTQTSEPFRVFGEDGLWCYRFVAEAPSAGETLRFKLGRRAAKAAAPLVSPVPREEAPFLLGLQGDDIRHDDTAEMRMVLKRLFFTDMGNFFSFRPTHTRSFIDLASPEEIGHWLDLVYGANGYLTTCFSQFWKRDASLELFRERGGAHYMGNMTHEAYIMLQKQWHTKKLAAARNVVEATAAYIEHIENHAVPRGESSVGEPSSLGVYARDAGFRYIFCEPVANFTLLTACTRGAIRGRDTRLGYHIPPDWYFGWPNDAKKNRRVACSFYCGYISGGEAFYLENSAFGTNANTRTDMEDAFCVRNREIMREFNAIARLHPRQGALERRIAGVFGNCNSAIWLHDDVLPELLDTKHEGGSGTNTGSNWTEPFWGKWKDNGSRECMRAVDAVAPPTPFKTRDRSVLKIFTGTPFGQYDVIQADFDTLIEYDLAFYTGFNLMADDHIRRLNAYVKAGGTVILSAAHLNATNLPKEKMRYLRSAAVADFLGAQLGAQPVKSRLGSGKNATDFAALPVRKLTSATVRREAGDGVPLLLENRIGRGRVLFFNAADYRSLFALLNEYGKLVHTEAAALGMEFGVSGSRKIFYGVYRDQNVRTLQMVNASWDETKAEKCKLVLWGKEYPVSLNPCEFVEVVACSSGAFMADSPYAKVEILSHTESAIRIRWTAMAPTKVRFFGEDLRLETVVCASGRKAPCTRDTFTLPRAAGEEVTVRLK